MQWKTVSDMETEKRAKEDNINKPMYYHADCIVEINGKTEPVTIECNRVINALKLNFNLGNVLKYIWRAGKKSKNTYINDLKKCRKYIEMEIEREESGI